jgi:adenylate cyclase
VNRSSSPPAEFGADGDGAATDGAPGENGTGDGLRELVHSLGIGIAVVHAGSGRCLFENERFFEWFPPDAADVDGDVLRRIPGLDVDTALARMADGRSYRSDADLKVGPRTLAVEVEVRAATLDGTAVLFVEATDQTKRKQAEYMLDSYSQMAERNARDLQREKERAERLLLNIMPRAVFEEMKDFGSVAPQRFDHATILMLDFVGFTSMSVSRDPGALVSELNDIFSAFDRIVELFNCERLKTIGDAYMAVAGIPEATEDHAQAVARVALRMRRYLERRNTSHREPWLGRIGIHSGPVVGSIVGVQKYVYDIFGPGVNLAARMEALSEPMQITVTQETYDLIHEEFLCTDLGEAEVKGFGTQRIYSLDGEWDRTTRR